MKWPEMAAEGQAAVQLPDSGLLVSEAIAAPDRVGHEVTGDGAVKLPGLLPLLLPFLPLPSSLPFLLLKVETPHLYVALTAGNKVLQSNNAR